MSGTLQTDIIQSTAGANPLIQGNQSGSAPAVGYLGERLEAERTSSAVLMNAATSTNVLATPLILTPGEWDVSAFVYLSLVGVTASGAMLMNAAISTTSATLPSAFVPDHAGNFKMGQPLTGNISSSNFDITLNLIKHRVTVSVNTNIYLVGNVGTFTGGSITALGGIYARRAD